MYSWRKYTCMRRIQRTPTHRHRHRHRQGKEGSPSYPVVVTVINAHHSDAGMLIKSVSASSTCVIV